MWGQYTISSISQENNRVIRSFKPLWGQYPDPFFFVLESQGSCPYCAETTKILIFCFKKCPRRINIFKIQKCLLSGLRSRLWYENLQKYPVISKLSPIYEQKCSRPMKFFESVPSNFKSVPDPWSFSKVSPTHEIFQKCPQW